MGSYDLINYALRANKAVERKLIVEVVSELKRAFDVARYRYVGLSSMWYVDFVLMHRTVGINKMVTIEKDLSREDRIRFNRPYGCIDIRMGETDEVLKTLEWNAERQIVWLDYDTGIRESALRDLEYLSGVVPSGSVLLATLNADHRQLELDGKTSPTDKEAVLRAHAGDLVPAPLDPKALAAARFPSLLAGMLNEHLSRGPKVNGRADIYVPLFNFIYRNGSPMITVGGLIVDAADAMSLEALRLRDRFEYLTVEPFEINMPPLTSKEKAAFDGLLPRARKGKKLTPKDLQFTLSESQIAAYSCLYKVYPEFREVFI